MVVKDIIPSTYWINEPDIIHSWDLYKREDSGENPYRKRKAITGDALFFLLFLRTKRVIHHHSFCTHNKCSMPYNILQPDTWDNLHSDDFDVCHISYFDQYAPPSIFHKTCVCSYSVIPDSYILHHKYTHTLLSKTKCDETSDEPS